VLGCGYAGLSDQERQQLQHEQQQYGDILFLDVIDTNDPDPPPNDSDATASSLKVVYGAKWAVEHYNFPWFVRLGDDTYFRVDHFLLTVASKLDKHKLVLGYRGKPSFAKTGILQGRRPSTVRDKSLGRPWMFHRVVSRLSIKLHSGPRGCMQ
jgi:hypothetical protein